MELVKVFNFSDKWPAFLEIIELGLNLGIEFCITSLVLSNYQIHQSVKVNFKLTAQVTLMHYLMAKPYHSQKMIMVLLLKKGRLCHRLIEYKLQSIKCICSELIITKQKLICFNIYRPPEYSYLTTFFEEITNALSKALLKREKIIFVDDFNIEGTRT